MPFVDDEKIQRIKDILTGKLDPMEPRVETAFSWKHGMLILVGRKLEIVVDSQDDVGGVLSEADTLRLAQAILREHPKVTSACWKMGCQGEVPEGKVGCDRHRMGDDGDDGDDGEDGEDGK